MGRKKTAIIIGAVLVLGAAGFGAVTYISSQKAKAEGIPVMEETVGRETITTKVTSKGEVSLLNTELIYASLVAEVDDVLVEKNDIVREGQPIIRYKEKSREDLLRNIEKAKLDVQSAEVSLSTSAIPPAKSSVEKAAMDVENAAKAVERAERDVADIDAEIARQSIKADDARNELNKSETLFSAGAISQSELDNARRALRDAEAALDTLNSSRENKLREIDTQKENHHYSKIVYSDTVNKLSEQSTQNNIRQQQITLEKARLVLAQLEQELADFQQEILSPINGTVTSVTVSRGEITPTDKALMEIADISDYIVKVDVNERNAAKVAIGQDVELTGAVLGDEMLKGKVSKIGHIAETKQNNSGTERIIPVEITVDKTSAADVLKPGFSLDANIITSVKENVVAIPILSTLSESDGNDFVFVIKDDNTLEKRPVTLGAFADMSVEAEGVNEGEKIVAQPSVEMEEGITVNVINRETAEDGAGGEKNDA